jgi:hypothetical protein
MAHEAYPYIRLRQLVRQAGQQFRHNNDNSTSMFHPAGGFVYGYDMAKVEDALNEYEKSLPTEFLSVPSALHMESQLLEEARLITETHESMEIRDFARQVMAYLVIHEGQQLNPGADYQSFLSLVAEVAPEKDSLD